MISVIKCQIIFPLKSKLYFSLPYRGQGSRVSRASGAVFYSVLRAFCAVFHSDKEDWEMMIFVCQIIFPLKSKLYFSLPYRGRESRVSRASGAVFYFVFRAFCAVFHSDKEDWKRMIFVLCVKSSFHYNLNYISLSPIEAESPECLGHLAWCFIPS